LALQIGSVVEKVAVQFCVAQPRALSSALYVQRLLHCCLIITISCEGGYHEHQRVTGPCITNVVLYVHQGGGSALY